MQVRDLPLDWYIEKLKKNEYFSMGMYGDGEWIAAFHEKIGKTNAEDTVYSKELCDALEASFKFRSPNFYFSAPAGLKIAQHTGIGEAKIDGYLKAIGCEDIEFIEKDTWNAAARFGLLKPFIDQLRKMNVCIISNKALRGLHFLNYDKFIEISYPNCFLDGSLDRAYDEAIAYGKPGVYLIAAGLPAALLVQKLHGKIPGAWVLDLGSIWDAFVKIGAQRGWREELYKDKEAWLRWFDKSVFGGMPMSMSYIADHYSVLKVKVDRGMTQYEPEMLVFQSMLPSVPELIARLYEINNEMFPIHDDMMKETDMAKVGEMSRRLLSMNSMRVDVRSEIAKMYGEFEEYKTYA